MNEQLRSIIAGVLEVSPGDIGPGSTAGDFEKWDALAQILMISEIQDKMGVEIPFDKMQSIRSVQDFIDCVE